MPKQTICLNLHERYAPDWGVWECARELFANAKDASPDGMRVTSPDANTLEIFTPTVPDLAEMFIIGCGSKSPEDEAIGQFGEGVKITALAAARKSDSSLTVRLPESTITFALNDHFGQRVLFAEIDDSEPFEGCLCTLKMEGAGYALNGRTIEGSTSHVIPKAPDAPVQIFSKGIWICNLDEKDALFSYNLNELELNRDRSHAQPWSLKGSIGKVLLNTLDDALADKIVGRANAWENTTCLACVSWSATPQQKEILANAVFRKHGPRAVVSNNIELVGMLRRQGYKPIPVARGLQEVLIGSSVPTDTELASRVESLRQVKYEHATWQPMIAEMRHLAEMLNLPDTQIAIFADEYGELLGKADSKNQIVWLNERLFNANRFERLRTFLHELAHIQGDGSDGSIAFEEALDLLLAKLAIMVLDKEIGRMAA